MSTRYLISQYTEYEKKTPHSHDKMLLQIWSFNEPQELSEKSISASYKNGLLLDMNVYWKCFLIHWVTLKS